MRTPLLAGLIAVLIPACMDGLTGVGGDDGTQSGATCGNAAVESGEACDDGNTSPGDGCSATCQTESGNSPRLTAEVDKPTISTELRTTHQITLTLTGVSGFGETVNLAGMVVGANDAPLTKWTVSFANASVAVPTNGMVTAVATLTVPSEKESLAAKVKLNITSSLGTQTVTSDVTAANQVTFTFHQTGNVCMYPSGSGTTASPIKVSAGTKIRWFNDGTGTNTFVIHVDGTNANGVTGTNVDGVTHQGQSPNGTADPVTEVNSAYEQTATVAGGLFEWYCHAPGPDLNAQNPGIEIVQ